MKFKVGDYIYTDDREYDICYDFTNNHARYLIGEILDLYRDSGGNMRFKVKWLNSRSSLAGETTDEKVTMTNTYFKVISYAKVLALLM